MKQLGRYQTILEDYFNQITHFQKQPETLYQPMVYLLSIGGKRIRPALALMVYEMFEKDLSKVLPVATAIEVFHNFTLMHDDIMDKADLRRGHQTVHSKWNLNTGILSGDAMLIAAYQILEYYPVGQYKTLMNLFNKTAIEVCEGQQLDIDFQTLEDVTIDQYLVMIRNKTAVLLAATLQMGSLVADASREVQQMFYDLGLYLGLAFQIQDDYLDAFGDQQSFGKRIGGDILENKKTYLYLKALELANDSQKKLLKHWESVNDVDKEEEKIIQVKQLFKQTKADFHTRQAIEQYTNLALQIIKKMDVNIQSKEQLEGLTYYLLNRVV